MLSRLKKNPQWKNAKKNVQLDYKIKRTKIKDLLYFCIQICTFVNNIIFYSKLIQNYSYNKNDFKKSVGITLFFNVATLIIFLRVDINLLKNANKVK